MPLPKPPCTRSCPKRCAVPNCHDPALCGDWAAYQAALQAHNASVEKMHREYDDLSAARAGEARRRKGGRQI